MASFWPGILPSACRGGSLDDLLFSSHEPLVMILSERLTLRELNTDDAPFILELLNDPDFHRYIGDRGSAPWTTPKTTSSRGRRSAMPSTGTVSIW